MPGTSYITHHRPRLEQRHYITDATTETMFFNFYENKLRRFVDSHGYDFCLVINGSDVFDHAFVLPFRDFRDFFSQDLCDPLHRWVGYIRAHDEVMRISVAGTTKERFIHEYHNAFHLLQDAPLPLPSEPHTSEYA